MTSDGTSVLIDRNRFNQILFYLVKNAIHRNRLGGNIVIRVNEHRLNSTETMLNIQVIDDGPDIDPEEKVLVMTPILKMTSKLRKCPHLQRLNLSNRLI